MSTLKITILPGDGIGPEVTNAAVSVLESAAEKYNFDLDLSYALIGGVAIEQENNPLPAATLESCRNSDAVLLGAIGDPRYSHAAVRPEQGLLALRKELELFANVRPVKIWPGLEGSSPLRPELLVGVDMVIYRELTGGSYFGARTEGTEEATDTCTYTRAEVERIASLAFAAAESRRGKLTMVDKANVLATSRLWRNTVEEMAPAYPNVEVDYLYVDNAAMQLVTNPGRFDVILTENMFGDILSDEASVLGGSLGLLPSASFGSGIGMFEPVHGSWPEATGEGIANPIATILSAAMLLRHCKQEEAALGIETAVTKTIRAGIVTPDLSTGPSYATNVVGEVIARTVAEEGFLPNHDNLQAMQQTII